MKTKYFLVFLALLLSQISNNAIAQRCLSFNYDADGNRIRRYVQKNCLEIKGELEVEDNEEITELSVFPNPTYGSFKIIMPDNVSNERSYCYVYDLNGVLIIEKALADEADVDIGNMPSGIYLLKIICGDVTYSKIIVKH